MISSNTIAKIIETEVFVQGALCTCFSGHCYMSAYIGGNSGNRGYCKQPCRKSYKLDGNGKSKYPISLSDLCLADYIQALKDTCNLFNVPYLDLLKNTNLRPNDLDFIDEFYLADGTGNNSEIDTDGVHPNSKGYRLFYNRIKEFIKTL